MVSIYEPYIGYLFNGINELLRRKMKNDNTRELVGLSLYAALIYRYLLLLLVYSYSFWTTICPFRMLWIL